jgi:hypothetical protein
MDPDPAHRRIVQVATISCPALEPPQPAAAPATAAPTARARRQALDERLALGWEAERSEGPEGVRRRAQGAAGAAPPPPDGCAASGGVPLQVVLMLPPDANTAFYK